MAGRGRTRAHARRRRRQRVRRIIHGTAERPRLNVFRSHNHTYAQVIIDDTGHTIAAASTLDPELRAELKATGDEEAARAAGRLIAKRALDEGVTKVSFDRAGYRYHGRVKALAEGAREAGLEF